MLSGTLRETRISLIDGQTNNVPAALLKSLSPPVPSAAWQTPNWDCAAAYPDRHLAVQQRAASRGLQLPTRHNTTQVGGKPHASD